MPEETKLDFHYCSRLIHFRKQQSGSHIFHPLSLCVLTLPINFCWTNTQSFKHYLPASFDTNLGASCVKLYLFPFCKIGYLSNCPVGFLLWLIPIMFFISLTSIFTLCFSLSIFEFLPLYHPFLHC